MQRLLTRCRRGAPGRVLLLLAAAAACAPRLEAQAVQRYARVWSTESSGAEVLFRPAEILVVPGSACAVWVTDAGSGAVYRWSCDGRPAARVGGKGEGPGQFQAPSTMAPVGGDTVGVWDHALRRLSFFTSAGRFVRARTLELSPARHGFVRAFARRRDLILAHTVTFPSTDPTPDENAGFIWHVAPDGSANEPLLRMAGPQVVVDRGGNASSRFDAPFQRNPVVVFLPAGGLLVGNTGSTQFWRYRAAPRMDRVGQFRAPLSTRQVSRADRRAWLDSMSASLRTDRERSGLDAAALASFARRHERMLERVEFPQTHVRYHLATADENGRLWLHVPGARGAQTALWQVHDATTGALLRRVELPTRNRIRRAAVRADAMYVIELTADGVPRVAKYAAPARR